LEDSETLKKYINKFLVRVKERKIDVRVINDNRMISYASEFQE